MAMSDEARDEAEPKRSVTKPKAAWTRSGGIRGGNIGTPEFWQKLEEICRKSINDDAREKIEQIARRLRGEVAVMRDSKPAKSVADELEKLESRIRDLENAFDNLSEQGHVAIEPYLRHFQSQNQHKLNRCNLEGTLICFRSAVFHTRRDLEAWHVPDDAALLNKYLPELIAIYKEVTGCSAGYSTQPDGTVRGGPFVRFVEAFVDGLGPEVRQPRPGKKRGFVPDDVPAAIKNWWDRRRLNRDSQNS